MKQDLTPEQIQDFLVQSLAKLMKVNPTEIETDIAFDRYGLDSASAVELTGLLGKWIDRELEPTLLYDHPTIERLTQYVERELRSGAA